MPTSSRRYDAEIKRWLEINYPSRKTPILDVGCGMGKFRKLLEFYKDVDGVEIWQPYIEKYGLDTLYTNIYNEDIRLWDATQFRNYKLVILGDVLEHLTVDEAKDLLAVIAYSRCDVLVCVPFEYHQDAVEGNIYEEHKQDDLTHTLFMSRYPGFSLFMKDNKYGIYFRKHGVEGRGTENVETLKVKKSFFDDKYLAFATPTTDTGVRTEYLGSMIDTVNTFNKLGIKSQLLIANGASVEKSRNHLVARFMQDERFTHLLFVDSDMGWNPRDVLRLLAFDKDVIGAACRKKTTDIEWNVNLIEEEISCLIDGLLEVAEIGTGFLMIKREVFSKMMEAYPELHAYALDERRPDDVGDIFTLFQFSLEDGRYISEDLTFCRRWRKLGGKIWIDPEASIDHVGSYTYSGSFSSAFVRVEDVA